MEISKCCLKFETLKRHEFELEVSNVDGTRKFKW